MTKSQLQRHLTGLDESLDEAQKAIDDARKILQHVRQAVEAQLIETPTPPYNPVN